MNKSILALVTMAVLATAACSSGLSEADKKSLLSSVDAALATSKKSDEARKAAAEALRKKPTVTATPCKAKVLRKGEMLDVGEYDNNASLIMRSLKLNIVYDEPGKPLKDGWRHSLVAKRAALLRRQITGKVQAGENALGKDGLDWAKERIAQTADTENVGRYELGAITTVLGHVTYDEKRFPSRVAVRVYAWDHKEQEIVCSAEVVEDLGGEVEVTYKKHEGMKAADVEYALQTEVMGRGLANAFSAMGVGAKVGR